MEESNFIWKFKPKEENPAPKIHPCDENNEGIFAYKIIPHEKLWKDGLSDQFFWIQLYFWSWSGSNFSFLYNIPELFIRDFRKDKSNNNKFISNFF